MVGVALALTLWGAADGIQERNQRDSWTDPFSWISADVQPTQGDSDSLPSDAVLLSSAEDYYHGQVITVVQVAASSSTTVQLPGVPAVPGPGQAVASPAAARLIASAPQDELGSRYGAVVAEISAEGLQSPESRVVVVGVDAQQMLENGTGTLVAGFTPFDFTSSNYRVLFAVGAVAVLIPVLLLIGIVTDLGSAQRAERMATLRLIGATPRRVAGLAAGETAVVTGLGALLGVAVYLVALPLSAQVRVGQGTFYLSDLLVTPLAAAVLVSLTVLAAAGIAWWRTLRADVGPLGVSRERAERTPRLCSLMPLAAGIVLLGVVVALGYAERLPEWSSVLIIVAFVLIAVGQLVAGPYLTWRFAHWRQPRTDAVAGLMALGRIQRHAHATFRAVAGFVVAVYLVTVYAFGVTAAVGALTAVDDSTHLPPDLLVVQFNQDAASTQAGEIAAQVRQLSGVTHAVEAFASAEDMTYVMSVADARAVFPDADVPEGTGWVSVDSSVLYGSELGLAAVLAPESEAPGLLLVAGDADARERARTWLFGRSEITPGMRTMHEAVDDTLLVMENEFAAMAYIGIVIATAISAAALAVAGLSSVIERRRVLGLMRLMGLRRATLRRVLSVETLVPVLTVLVLTVALGAFTAWGLVGGLTAGRRQVTWPEWDYYAMLCLCALLMVGAGSGTFRAAMRTTGAADTTRFE